MSPAHLEQPQLVGLDEDTRKNELDQLEHWLGNVLMAETMYERLLADTIGKVHTPHVKEELRRMHARAEEHVERAEEIYRVIGRDPANARQAGSTLMSKARQAMADFEGIAGGAHGAWRDLQQLLLTNLKSTGAFGTAMQLGTALGIPEIGKIALPVMNKKFNDQRWLQETLMETAPVAILRQKPI